MPIAALPAPEDLHADHPPQDPPLVVELLLFLELEFLGFFRFVELWGRQLGGRRRRSELVNDPIKSKLTEERKLTSEEADRVLARATELMSTAEGPGRLSREDLKEGAAEAGIAPHYVEEALAQLQREDIARRHTIARRRRALAVALGMLVVITLATGLYTRSTLEEKLSEVRRRELQLQNVIERRDALLPQLEALRAQGAAGDSALLLRLMDEHTGAANRVSTERRRYEEAVVDYEATAATPPRNWFRLVTGHPAKILRGTAPEPR